MTLTRPNACAQSAYTVETGGNVHGFATWAAAWSFLETLDAASITDWAIGSNNSRPLTDRARRVGGRHGRDASSRRFAVARDGAGGMSGAKEPGVKAQAAPADFTHDALAIRTVDPQDRAYGKFQWPTETGAMVDCPDWSSKAVCGSGFHALLDGIGDWSLINRGEGMVWQVVGVIRDECVAIDDDKVSSRAVVFSIVAKKAARSS